MRDLSVLIPARNERFLKQTIENVLQNIEADTEVIAVLDAYWPNPPIEDHPRVTILHVTESIGQRGATNVAARLSQAKYVMKLDAHCAVGKGFDRILIEDCQYDWTMIPMLYNLHAFDWECQDCGNRVYQGSAGYCGEKFKSKRSWTKPGCGSKNLKIAYVWKPREGKGPYVGWRFDRQMQFKQWRKYHKRPEAQRDLVETMSFAGPCFFIHRDRYWELGGCDEAHGSWGQFGTEWACKTWLSGGRLITTRKTWFAHMFRTGNFSGSFQWGCFPYPLSGRQQERAKLYSRDLWLNDKWKGAKRPLSWLIDKFKPVPDWHDKEGNLLHDFS